MTEIAEQLSKIISILGTIHGMFVSALAIGVVMYVLYLTNRK